VFAVEGGLMEAKHSARCNHASVGSSGRACLLLLHAAAERAIGDVRIFGGVWYEILHTSGGLPKRVLHAA
jgi:hypothetical protein